MKVVITCGHPQSDYQAIHSLMVHSGLKDVSEHVNGHLSPLELQSKICSTYKLDEHFSAPIKPLTPGQFWSNASTDLFMNNLDTEYWGWADSNTVHLLDHWRDYEDNIRFVLVYNSPNRALAKALPFMPASAEATERLTESWFNYNDALLRFYYRNKERCVLINADAKALREGALPGLAEDHLSVDLKPTDTTELEVYKERDRYTDIAALISQSMRAELDEAESLYQEMEAVADLPTQETINQEQLKLSAWKQYNTILAEIENYKAISECAVTEREEAIERAQTLEAQADELRDHDLQIAKERERLLAELERTNTRIVTLESQPPAPAASPEADPQHVKELEEENELLILQLHQVQEELEQYYLKYIELKETSASPKPEKKKPAKPVALIDGCHIDLRQAHTPGKGWHDAEHDGRWTGPDANSSVNLPVLASGNYRITMQVVDAMTPEILRSLRATIGGAEAKLNIPNPVSGLFKKRARYPVTVTGSINLPTGVTNEGKLELHLGGNMSPAIRGEADQRQLGIRVREIKLQKTGKASTERKSDNTHNHSVRPKPVEGLSHVRPEPVEGLPHARPEPVEGLPHARPEPVEGLSHVRPEPVEGPINPITIDLRQHFTGQNWHHAEADGRWAGPGNRSTIELPKLSEGRYRIDLDVVDSITPDILKLARLSLNGERLQVTKTSEAGLAKRLKCNFAGNPSYPVKLSANVDVAVSDSKTPKVLQLDFPATISPVVFGKPDSRQLALRIRQVTVRTVD